MDGYKDLANAIVIMGAKDYRKALKKLKRNPNNRKAKEEAKEVERFFKGSWMKELTKVDGEFLMERIKEEVYNDDNKRILK